MGSEALPNLTVTAGPDEGRRVEFVFESVCAGSAPHEARYILGLRLSEPHLAKQHFLVELGAGGGHRLVPFKGCQVVLNGSPLTRAAALADGDRIAIGGTELRFELPAPARRALRRALRFEEHLRSIPPARGAELLEGCGRLFTPGELAELLPLLQREQPNFGTMTLARLVHLHGDSRARELVGLVLKRLEERIAGVFRLARHDPAEAEELTQEATIEAWKALSGRTGRFVPGMPVWPYVQEICRNMSRDQARRARGRARERRLEGQDLPAAAPGGQALDAREELEHYRALLAAQFPRHPDKVTAFLLVEGGLTQEAVAERMGRARNTIRAWTEQVRQRLDRLIHSCDYHRGRAREHVARRRWARALESLELALAARDADPAALEACRLERALVLRLGGEEERALNELDRLIGAAAPANLAAQSGALLERAMLLRARGDHLLASRDLARLRRLDGLDLTAALLEVDSLLCLERVDDAVERLAALPAGLPREAPDPVLRACWGAEEWEELVAAAARRAASAVLERARPEWPPLWVQFRLHGKLEGELPRQVEPGLLGAAAALVRTDPRAIAEWVELQLLRGRVCACRGDPAAVEALGAALRHDPDLREEVADLYRELARRLGGGGLGVPEWVLEQAARLLPGHAVVEWIRAERERAAPRAREAQAILERITCKAVRRGAS